jgi:glycosyltransferase involved in cell wall biosynthesis
MSVRARHFLTIIASRYEVQGYVLMEAMSLGSPIVATAVGGIPEFITSRRNGLLVPAQDPAAMAAACKTLLENRPLAAQYGRQAWLDCRESYGVEKIANQTISVYEEAIDAAKAAD